MAYGYDHNHEEIVCKSLIYNAGNMNDANTTGPIRANGVIRIDIPVQNSPGNQHWI